MESLFSPSWYRVAGLKPRLRGHARIRRHQYRGEIWYVLNDTVKGRFYRFTPPAHHVIGLMDGDRTVQEIWERTVERFGDEGPTQSEVLQLLAQLHATDLLISDVTPDTAELLRRAEQTRRTRWWMNLRTPLALRFPLVDPERFLARTVRFVRPLFGFWGAVLWIAVVAAGDVLAVSHWKELTENVVDRVLSIDNLLVLWVAYPIVKALHELAHGYAIKAWGGECHEMGILLLVLIPVPYVDASASSEFREKHRRALVGAAGIAMELLLASIALFVWLNMEPGLIRSAAYNVVLIGSVSTVLFNANPLLRYDGYYILSDLLDVPNLSQRGIAYLKFAFQRYALRLKDLREPHSAPGERFWFVVYTVTSFFYRLFIYTAIILFITKKFFVIGVLMAVWALFSMVVVPAYKGTKFLVSSPMLREKRPRALALTTVSVTIVALALFVLPFPCWTRAEGVVWVPEDSLLRAGTSCFVSRVAATPGARVARGDVLVECRDPFIAANVRVLEAQLEEMRARYDAARTEDPVQAQVMMEEIRDTESGLARAQERFSELELRSPTDGVLFLPDAQDLPDIYLKQGDLIGYVIDVDRPTIRVVVPQSRVDLVRQRARGVAVRLAHDLHAARPALVKREVPGGLERLPSTVLGRGGGGEIPIDPMVQGGTTTFEKTFQFDVELTEPLEEMLVGGRAYVRFEHGTEPVAFQIYRSVRQLLLRRLNV